MNDARYQKLLEISWRRALTESEILELRDLLARFPGLRSHWLEDQALDRALRWLPDLPVPSNFAASLDQAISLHLNEKRSSGRPLGRIWRFRFLWPRLGLGLASVALAFLITHQYRAHARLRMAQGVAMVSKVAAGPKLEWLEDFEAIHELQSTPPLDEELYSLLEHMGAIHELQLTPPPGVELLASVP